jgi:hypothetical protein
MSKYSKNLAGLNAQGFVVSAALAGETTYSAFVDTAPAGEIGVFLESGALNTDALVAGERFFIAQKRGGVNFNGATEVFVHKTPLIDFDKCVFSKTDYDAPVVQVTTVGYNGTAGSSLNIDLTVPGTQELVISARCTSPGNQPFPVEEGRGISTRVTDVEYDVVSQMVKDINGVFDYERNQDDSFIFAEILSNGSQAALPAVTLTTNNGDTLMTYSGAHGLSAGDYIGVLGVLYKVADAPSSVTINTTIPFAGVSQSGLAAGTTTSTHGTVTYVDATTELGVRLTATDNDTHFVVSVQDDLEGATVTETTAWNQGSGDGPSIVEWEKEAIIFSGVGSTVNAAFKDDYGQPTAIAAAASNYDTYFIDISQALAPSAGSPVAITNHLGHVMIAAVTGGGGIAGSLDTIFGL